jgi:hypothetical protein
MPVHSVATWSSNGADRRLSPQGKAPARGAIDRHRIASSLGSDTPVESVSVLIPTSTSQPTGWNTPSSEGVIFQCECSMEQ